MPLAGKTEFLVVQLLLKTVHPLFFLLREELEDLIEMEEPVPTEETVDTEELVLARMPETGETQQQTFLMMRLLENLLLVAEAGPDMKMVWTVLVDYRMGAQVVLTQVPETAITEKLPAAVVVLEITDVPAVPVPMVAFTCDSIGNEG